MIQSFTPSNTVTAPRLQRVVAQLQEQNPADEAIVTGPTGCGKLTAVREFAELSGRAHTAISLHAASDPTEVNGRYVADEGGVRFEDSPIKKTAEAEGVVVLSDPNLASPETQDALADMIRANPAAKFVAVMEDPSSRGVPRMTENLAGAFGGQPQSLADQLRQITMEPARASEVAEAMSERFTNIPTQDVKITAMAFDTLQDAQQKRLIGGEPITVRDFFGACKAASEAIEQGVSPTQACRQQVAGAVPEADQQFSENVARMFFGEAEKS